MATHTLFFMLFCSACKNLQSCVVYLLYITSYSSGDSSAAVLHVQVLCRYMCTHIYCMTHVRVHNRNVHIILAWGILQNSGPNSLDHRVKLVHSINSLSNHLATVGLLVFGGSAAKRGKLSLEVYSCQVIGGAAAKQKQVTLVLVPTTS